MSNTLALHAIAILVLLPSTLVSSFWTLFGVVFVADSFRRADHQIAGAILLVAMIAGWFGLVITWRLYYGLLRAQADFNRRIAWLGLVCGSLTSLGLIATTGGSLFFRVVFFGWPLLATAFFSIALLRLRPNHSFKPNGLRPSA